MKYFITLLLIFGTLCLSAQLSVNPRIKYHVEVDGVDWDVDAGGTDGDPEGRWKVRTQFSPYSSNSCDPDDYTSAPCIERDSYSAITGLQRQLRASNDAAYTTYVYYNVLAFEKDGDKNCDYDGNDDYIHCGRGTIDFKNHPVSAFYTYPWHNIQLRGWSDIRMRQIWAYRDGQWGETAALNFGVLESGIDYHHDNSTVRINYSGQTFGYTSTFDFSGINRREEYPYGTSIEADVTYTFEIKDASKMVTIDATSVSYKHHLILLREESDGSKTYVTTNDGNYGSIVQDLCPGKYFVIFDPAYNFNLGIRVSGPFQLNVSASEVSIDPGIITAGESTLCEGVIYPVIGNGQSASSNLALIDGPERYEWEKKVIGGEYSGFGFSEETVDTLAPIGTMGTQNVIFRRRAYFCDIPTSWTYDTIYYQPSTITPGEIENNYVYDNSNDRYVRANYLLEGDITEGVVATAEPLPISYKWEKRRPNASSFEEIKIGNQTYQEASLTPEALGPLSLGNTNLRRIAINGCGNEALSNELVIEGRAADGSISGKITAPPLSVGPGIADVEVCAIPQNPIYGTTMVCDTSDFNGNYLLDELYYQKEGVTSYEVIPKYLDHIIRINETSEDSTLTFDLSSTTHNIQLSTNFVDLSVFTIQGNVYQTFAENGLADVDYGLSQVVIYLENTQTGYSEIKDTTDANGDYNIIIPNGGTWKITPKLVEEGGDSPHEHTFVPASRSLVITESLTNVDFQNTTVMDISGFVGASCNNYLGTVELRFYQQAEVGTFDRSFRTNLSTGTFGFTLPARDYIVEVVDLSVEDKSPELFNYAKVEDQFAGFLFNAALMHRDTSFELLYRAPPTITIEGIPALPTCSSGTYEYPILEKDKYYPNFKIKAWDGVVSNSCPLDTGYMDVVDGIGSRRNGRIPVSNGEIDFMLLAGDPNIVEATNYLLTTNFIISDFVNPESASYNLTALVTGGKAKKSTFTTVSPELPLLVLHDPPGDNSYSYFTEESSFETRIATYAKKSGSLNTWAKLRTGVKVDNTVDFGAVEVTTGVQQWVDISGSVKVDRIRDTTNTTALRLSNLHYMQTSSSPNFIGDQGDLFYGAAYNYIYSLTDEVSFDYNTCVVDTGTSFFLNPDSIATTFLKTTRQIENDIAELTKLRDIQSPDSMVYYQNQIDIWEQTLLENRNTKEEAAANGTLLRTATISSGIIDQLESTSTVDTISSIEFLIEVDKDFAVEAGIEISGNGVSGGVYGKIRTESGSDSTTTSTISTTYGYRIEDDDTDDEFIINIYEDDRYGTPLFVTTSAFSSCPYEDIRYLGVDQFVFAHHIDSEPVQTSIDPMIGASYKVVLSNTGPLTRTYLIGNDDAYNQDGLQVSIQGNVPGIDAQITLDSPDDPAPTNPTSVEITIVVNKDPAVNVYSYRDLKINVDPICNPTVLPDATRQSLFFSATFEGDCSNMDITSPTDNTVVNISNENILPMRLQNYVKSKMDRAVLQYRPFGEQGWSTSSDVDLTSIDLEEGPSGTQLDWNLSEVTNEGLTEIRFKITCTTPGTAITNINYSNIVLINIDRVAPEVYGIPTPIDDVYNVSSNDEISVSFNEPICSSGASQASAIIVDLVTQDSINTTVSCFDNTIKIVEEGQSLEGRAPSVYRVILTGVEDLQGNKANSYRWVFIVGDYVPQKLGCIEGLEIVNNNENQDAINVSTYQAISLEASGLIAGYGLTGFKAQESIALMPGFEVSSGGAFTAEIENCEN